MKKPSVAAGSAVLFLVAACATSHISPVERATVQTSPAQLVLRIPDPGLLESGESGRNEHQAQMARSLELLCQMLRLPRAHFTVAGGSDAYTAAAMHNALENCVGVPAPENTVYFFGAADDAPALQAKAEQLGVRLEFREMKH